MSLIIYHFYIIFDITFNENHSNYHIDKNYYLRIITSLMLLKQEHDRNFVTYYILLFKLRKIKK